MAIAAGIVMTNEQYDAVERASLYGAMSLMDEVGELLEELEGLGLIRKLKGHWFFTDRGYDARDEIRDFAATMAR